MAHWLLVSTGPRRQVVSEFDTNAGGAAADLVAARAIATTYATANMMKVALCAALRIITPSSAPPPPTAQDDPYP